MFSRDSLYRESKGACEGQHPTPSSKSQKKVMKSETPRRVITSRLSALLERWTTIAATVAPRVNQEAHTNFWNLRRKCPWYQVTQTRPPAPTSKPNIGKKDTMRYFHPTIIYTNNAEQNWTWKEIVSGTALTMRSSSDSSSSTWMKPLWNSSNHRPRYLNSLSRGTHKAWLMSKIYHMNPTKWYSSIHHRQHFSSCWWIHQKIIEPFENVSTVSTVILIGFFVQCRYINL